MQDVLKIVRLRLKRSQSTAPETHPDADLLTAFAEHSLTGAERMFVMEHLARCGDCRDVVALAMPDAEPVAVPEAARPTRTGWFSLPMLRWGALAAGVLAVASVGVVEYRHRVQDKTLATNAMQRYSVTDSVAKNEPASTPTVAPQAIVPQNGVSKEAVAPRAHPALSEEKAAPLAGPVLQQPQSRSLAKSAGASGTSDSSRIGSGEGMGIGGGKFDVTNKRLSGADRKDVASASTPAAASPQPAPTAPREVIPEMRQQVMVGQATEMVEVEAAAGAVNTETATLSAQNQIAQNQQDLPLQGRNFTNLTNLDVVKAKDLARAKAASVPPRWAINSAGVLQRSFDGGATWEMVNPNTESARVGSLKQAESVASTGAAVARQYGADKAKKVQKAEAPPNASLVFRAVSAAGLEVWAGGSGGTLYHSADGGNSWTMVAPMAAGTILVGDIIGIEFTDPQHGRVTTSSAEVWTTADGGQTWRKQ
jgi:hypothetical protein